MCVYLYRFTYSDGMFQFQLQVMNSMTTAQGWHSEAFNSSRKRIDNVAVAMQGDFFGNSMSYMGNGYELLRQLVKEFSMRFRSEAVSLRASLMSKVFQANASYGAPVADTIRQIEVAVARYLRLVSTLIDEDVNGLGVGDSDQLTLLIRSLAEPAKS